MRHGQVWLLAACAALASGAVWAGVDLEPYLRRDAYDTIKISPDGRYYAATVELEDRTKLVVLDRKTGDVVSSAGGVKHSAIADFWWVDDTRVVLAMAERYGSQDPVYPTGELHAFTVGDPRPKALFGDASPFGRAAQFGNQGSFQMATVIDPMLDDEKFMLISAAALTADPTTRVLRVNKYTGGTTTVATAPVRRAEFTVDAHGVVRFADGAGDDNARRLYYRAGAEADWQLVNDESKTHRVMSALGLSADGRMAYMLVEQDEGPDAIETWDVQTHSLRLLQQDPVVDPFALVYDVDGRTPVGAKYVADGVHTRFFDETTPLARMYRALEAAFPDTSVQITSFTRDGGLALVRVWSDRITGRYVLCDMHTRTLTDVFTRRAWLDADTLPATRQIALPARDGVPLHGYLTLPAGKSGKDLPLVIVPHGGPYGVFDDWGFDDETQLLAAAGYAVLRINYRGSGNYGRQFEQRGAREWGGAMQDDVTDATRWAIAQGIADPTRICLYGASYGGYTALMGVAREPDLYRCAVGYVGVYDLVEMHRQKSKYAKWTRNWMDDWVGERGDLAQSSPINLAKRIKAPVLLVAGGADTTAPIAHSRKMEAALRDNGTAVETLYVSSEGHGFSEPRHIREFYVRLLGFLSRELGGAAAN